MKKILAAGWMLLSISAVSAQQFSKSPTPQLSLYVYCEIIANHLPTTSESPVLLDFGQDTGMSYNKLCDENGKKIKFNSGIEALNYMVSRDWEFVQAYTSGESQTMKHYLLRMPTAQLTDAWRQQFLPATTQTTQQAAPPEQAE